MIDNHKADEFLLEDNFVVDGEASEAKTASRIRSEAVFPYASLEDAQSIIQIMHAAGGVPLSRDQIQARIGGGRSLFISKLSAAVIFGLVTRTDRTFRMTPLAHRMLSDNADVMAQARVDALLTPELYNKIIEHFRGMQLPGREGVENAFRRFGVSEKQKDRARQVFERSALYAGYLNSARDRLVAPVIGSGQSVTTESRAITSQATNTEDPDPSEEKLIRGMLDLLPKIGSEWKAEERARWLRRLSNNLAAVYDADDDEVIEIKIRKQGD
ncbi:MAG TPA: hypothetical protein VL356_06080 [Acidocella sp.]|jgi:hypothetical protein|nr:hypothetical protein [Acidocella sp.]